METTMHTFLASHKAVLFERNMVETTCWNGFQSIAYTFSVVGKLTDITRSALER